MVNTTATAACAAKRLKLIHCTCVRVQMHTLGLNFAWNFK